MFIDQVRIYVKAGDGGNGCVSFRREKYVPRGGPDGGDGGQGGNIILVGSNEHSTLLDLRYQQHYMLPNAEDGSGQNCTGKNGCDLLIPVPVGTIIYNDVTHDLVADITEAGQQVVVARAGKGGRGNTHFKSATRQAPRIAEEGTTGESFWLQLELKLLADIGLVGFPNAGKSTLISAISAARPKIADYPFTTMTPHLGVVTWGDDVHFTVADVPGLVEGAHQGKGLGIQFLKHLERTSLLVHLIDVSDFGTSDPIHDLQVIRSELSAYAMDLHEKPFMVVATKVDSVSDRSNIGLLQDYCQRGEILFFEISAVVGTGLKALIHAMGSWVVSTRHQSAPSSVTARDS